MIFSRIGNSLTRSRNVINRASGFAAPTVNGCLNQCNRRFLRNLTAIGDCKKLDSRASSLGLNYLAANHRNCRFFGSASPNNIDHMKNGLKSESGRWFEINIRIHPAYFVTEYMKNELKSESGGWFGFTIMLSPAKDYRYTILSQGKRRYFVANTSVVSVLNAFFWTWFVMRISFAIGVVSFLLALLASLMKLEMVVASLMELEIGVALPIPIIPPALFALMLSPLVLPILRLVGLPLFVRIFGRK